MIFYLILLLLVSQSSSSSVIELEENSSNIYTIHQQTLIRINNNNSGYILIVENQDHDTMASNQSNNKVIKSASWMGVYGNYLIYIPQSDKLNTITISPLESNTPEAQVKLTLTNLKDFPQSTIQGIKFHIKANNLRINDYLDGTSHNEESLDYFQRAIELFQKNKSYFYAGLSSFEKAIALNNSDKQEKSIATMQQSINYWQKSHNLSQIIRVNNRLGLAYWKTNQLEKAQNEFQAIISSTISNNNTIIKSQALSNLGLISLENGKVQKAINLFTETLKINRIDFNYKTINKETIINTFAQNNNLKNIVATLNNLAVAYDANGNPETAEKLWSSYLFLSKNLKDVNTNAKAKQNLSRLLFQKGQYSQAIKLLKESIIVFEQSKNTRWLSLALYNLAKNYQNLGLFRLAEITIKKSIDLRRVQTNPKGFVESNLLLIDIYTKQLFYKKSNNLIPSTLKVAQKNNFDKAIAFLYLNQFHENLNKKDFNSAEKYINLALEAIENKNYTRTQSKILINKAHLLVELQDYASAIKILKKETNKLKDIWDTTLLNTANNLLAQTYLKNKQPNKAKKVIIEEIDSLNFYINSASNDKIRNNLSAMLKETLAIYNVITTLEGQPQRGFIKTNQVLAAYRHYNKLEKHQSNLSAKSVNSLLTTIQSKSHTLENQKLSNEDRKLIQDNIIELKAQLDFSYLSSKEIIVEEINIQSIQDKLDDNMLIIQFSIGKNNGVSWWLSKNKFESFVLNDKENLTNLIKAAHNELTKKSLSYQNIKKLSVDLLKPLANYKNINSIQLILDEPLNLIPFNALLDPSFKIKQVLADHVLIRRLSSIQSINQEQKLAKKPSKEMTVLVIADPVTNTNDARLTKLINQKSLPFKRIKGTQKEALNIANLFKTKTLQGFDANKELVLKSQFDKNEIIHFATHAFFHPEVPGLSSIVLSSIQENGASFQSAYLRALDINSMEINAELVVLSGCETGIGQYDNSLGLGGLTQSFMQAGSKNLIASLWKVNDKVTEKMMAEFYRGYHEGLSIQQALSQAQKLIRHTKNTNHPKYWAGWFLLSQ